MFKTANTFVITGGAPGAQQFRIIDGDTSALKGKIGQTVKVVGMVGDSDPARVASPALQRRIDNRSWISHDRRAEGQSHGRTVQ